MFTCIWNCLKAIPWWAWLILMVAAILIAIISYFFTGGIAALTWPLWIEAALVGLGFTFGLTLLYCLQDCRRG